MKTAKSRMIDGKLHLNDAIDIFGDVLSKVVVSFECECCGKESVAQYRRISQRKYLRNEPICSDCIMNQTTLNDTWRENNSKAQLVAQNRPEVVNKRNKAVKQAMARPEHRKKKSDAMKKRWKDPEQASLMRNNLEKIRKDPSVLEKQQLKNRFHTGYYDSKFGRMFYNSSWELGFIKYCESSKFVGHLARCSFYIEYYYDGKKRKYFPDFIMENDDKRFIIEIKGGWGDPKMVEAKKQAALRFVESRDDINGYYVYNKKELKKLGIETDWRRR